MATYQEKLKDPRWQKKRLEILERDNWECQNCSETKKTLCVHHRTYFPNKDPWDYDNELLISLCEDCHSTPDEVAPWSVYDKIYLYIGIKIPSKETILAFREAIKLGLFNENYLEWLKKSVLHDIRRDNHIRGVFSKKYLKYLKSSSGI